LQEDPSWGSQAAFDRLLTMCARVGLVSEQAEHWPLPNRNYRNLCGGGGIEPVRESPSQKDLFVSDSFIFRPPHAETGKIERLSLIDVSFPASRRKPWAHPVK